MHASTQYLFILFYFIFFFIFFFYQIRDENHAKFKISYSCGHRVSKSARYDASINIAPLDELNEEPCLLSSPKTWTEMGLFPLSVNLKPFQVIFEQLKFIYFTIRRSMPTCHKMRIFICKHLYPN